ncbi:type II toxin-antitoxin system MqsR family toxin, partial [Shewanella colwelliana]|uniref:type II toxin-antitoxin system MqsR family toxin n=1 Tax=Shewanella colwelliana TaxID=23 RepID=UPI003734FA06
LRWFTSNGYAHYWLDLHSLISCNKPLLDIQKFFSSIKNLRMIKTARIDATGLGFDDQDIIDAIQSINNKDFYKTMPSRTPGYPYHDVYKFMFKDVYVYLKFQDLNGHMVVSFKRV